MKMVYVSYAYSFLTSALLERMTVIYYTHELKCHLVLASEVIIY